MPNWSPESWNSFGVVGLVVAMGFLTFLALSRGWIVLGPAHREIVAGKDSELASKDRELDRADARANKDAETINVQAQTIANNTAIQSLATHMLSSFREAAERGGPE